MRLISLNKILGVIGRKIIIVTVSSSNFNLFDLIFVYAEYLSDKIYAEYLYTVSFPI